MAVQFNVPSGPTIYTQAIDYFKGVDLYNAPTNVEPCRSPEAPNMIRDEVGKVRKRMGYHTVDTFPGKINGVYVLNGKRLVHCGTALYAQGEGGGEMPGYKLLTSTLADDRSWGVQMNGKLYLLDGVRMLVVDGDQVKDATEVATVPVVLISKKPTGGGTQLNPFNLLSRWWTEQFNGETGVTAYHLCAGGLDADKVKVEIAQTDGTWKALTEGTDFTVDREKGIVTFKAAPGEPPVTGTDNVRITAAKTRDGYPHRITKCKTGILYGVNGAQDRLFVTGNPDCPNLDFYSAYNDPTYFGDTWYCQVGQDDGEIMGYSVVGNLLAAHKSHSEDGRNIVVRSGSMDSGGNAIFPIVNTIQGEGAVSRRAFGAMSSEPVFLTPLGVYAITAQELTGERYSQQRGLYLSTAIQQEPGLENAVSVVWRDFYVLAVNERVYLLDGLQKEYAKDAPQSSFQYEGYYWENIRARVLWVEAGKLCFGTEDGKLCQFYDEPDDPNSYNDDGAAIMAYWDTPDLDGHGFWKNKTFRYVACRLAAAVVTGVKIFAQVRGLWRQIFDAGQKARYLDWSYINFEKFVFSADRTPRTLGGKIKLKKVDKVRFRFQNGELNEPFGLYSVGFEYTEPGSRYKG